MPLFSLDPFPYFEESVSLMRIQTNETRRVSNIARGSFRKIRKKFLSPRERINVSRLMHSRYTRGRTSSNFQCKSGTAGAYVNSPLQIPRGGCYINPSLIETPRLRGKKLCNADSNFGKSPIASKVSRGFIILLADMIFCFWISLFFFLKINCFFLVSIDFFWAKLSKMVWGLRSILEMCKKVFGIP